MGNLELPGTAGMKFPRGLEICGLGESMREGLDDCLNVLFGAFGRARQSDDKGRVADTGDGTRHDCNYQNQSKLGIVVWECAGEGIQGVISREADNMACLEEKISFRTRGS